MTTRISRRAVLAFIALTDAPMPERIDFNAYGDDTTFGLTFTRISQARAWLGVFGAGVLTEPVERQHEAKDDKPAWRRFVAYDEGDWRGWRIRIDAHEDIDAPGGQLDDDTAAQLRDIAGSAS